ncbi:M15 family metallopeptidase [Kribbella sp. HUAS MG21]|uniref:M15 family metallopeptidase n=1 Tax=Kribbella sp. HUAS MG21 TaxID=3160966 RepID=A0AAU7TEW1_9ACTN
MSPSPSPSPTPTPTPSPSPTPTPTETPTSKAAAAAWSITLDQPAASWEDRPTVFTGKISQPITGSYITLWQRVPGAWVLRAATRTTTGGVYRFSYVSAYTGTWAFRTMIGVKAETALAISDYRTVPIQDRKIVVNTPAPWYATLTGVSVTGKMVPAEPGKELALQEYLGSGRWRLVNIAKMDAAGNFRLRMPDDLPATRTVRVVTRYVTQSEMEYSAPATIVIKAALNPKVYAVSAAMVPYTYRAGCPVRPSSLRLLQLNYWGFDGRVHRGELILRDAAVPKMITVWNSTLAAKFPIRQMRRVDVFGGSDIKSMAADNTSAFNCRRVTGDPYSLSPHSYGWAIDINTVENPYLAANGVWYPSNGTAYIKRSPARPGMLFSTSTATKALIGQGYFWGANWAKPDYQHFQPK